MENRKISLGAVDEHPFEECKLKDKLMPWFLPYLVGGVAGVDME